MWTPHKYTHTWQITYTYTHMKIHISEAMVHIENMQYLSFWVWVILLNMPFRFIHIAINNFSFSSKLTFRFIYVLRFLLSTHLPVNIQTDSASLLLWLEQQLTRCVSASVAWHGVLGGPPGVRSGGSMLVHFVAVIGYFFHFTFLEQHPQVLSMVGCLHIELAVNKCYPPPPSSAFAVLCFPDNSHSHWDEMDPHFNLHFSDGWGHWT